jgi:hypothetical protein
MVGFKACIEGTLVREKEKNAFYFVFFLLRDSAASEFYVPTFRNILSHIHRWCKQEWYFISL